MKMKYCPNCGEQVDPERKERYECDGCNEVYFRGVDVRVRWDV